MNPNPTVAEIIPHSESVGMFLDCTLKNVHVTKPPPSHVAVKPLSVMSNDVAPVPSHSMSASAHPSNGSSVAVTLDLKGPPFSSPPRTLKGDGPEPSTVRSNVNSVPSPPGATFAIVIPHPPCARAESPNPASIVKPVNTKTIEKTWNLNILLSSFNHNLWQYSFIYINRSIALFPLPA